MSVDHTNARLAIRQRLKTLSVATTGAITMSAAGGTYTRASGSFLDDGFRAGMEVVGSGFSNAGNNVTGVVMAVSALTLTVDQGLVTEASAAGRTLAAGLPSSRMWENETFDPTPGTPYLVEQFLSGPTNQATTGGNAGAWLDFEPTYVAQFNVPEDTGSGALDRYADAVLELFQAGTTMTLANGDRLKVRGEPAPFRGAITYIRAGFATVSVSVPLRVYTLTAT